MIRPTTSFNFHKSKISNGYKNIDISSEEENIFTDYNDVLKDGFERIYRKLNIYLFLLLFIV